MAWIGALDHMYDYILKNKLLEFNSSIKKRTDKYGSIVIKDKDDFCDIKEKVFIEVCRSAKIITPDVRKILDEKLGVRNSCAHPSTISIHPTKAINFIEDITDNIYVKYVL